MDVVVGIAVPAGGCDHLTKLDLVEGILGPLSRVLDKDAVHLGVRKKGEQREAARADGSFPIKVLTLRAGDRRPLGR
jgi:hypothetical protein